MERIEITIQPVQRGLHIRRLFFDYNVRPALRWIVCGCSRSSVYFLPRGVPKEIKEKPT